MHGNALSPFDNFAMDSSHNELRITKEKQLMTHSAFEIGMALWPAKAQQIKIKKMILEAPSHPNFGPKRNLTRETQVVKWRRKLWITKEKSLMTNIPSEICKHVLWSANNSPNWTPIVTFLLVFHYKSFYIWMFAYLHNYKV